MNDAQWVGIALIVLALAIAYDLIQGTRKGQFKYRVKAQINNLWPSMCLILAVYAVCIGIFPVPWLVAKSIELSANDISTFGSILTQWIPVAYLVLLVGLMYKIMAMGWKPLLKYTEQELQWARESREKFRNKYPNLLDLLRFFC